MGGIAPAPRFPERVGTFYERQMGPNIAGQRGPLRFEEGIETDTDVPNDFALGISQGNPSAGRPNHNQKVDEKYPEETMRERAHVGSAAWIDSPAYLSEFSEGAFSGAGELHYEQVDNSGLRMQRRSPTVITD